MDTAEAVLGTDWEQQIDGLAPFVADYLRSQSKGVGTSARDRTQAWIEQFPLPLRHGLLVSLAATLERTYVWEPDVTAFLQGQVGSKSLWSQALLCRGARRGRSHAWATGVIETSVERYRGKNLINPSGVTWRSSRYHVFIDDAVFSGGRLREDYCALWDRPESDTWTPREPADGPLSIYILQYVTHTAAQADFAAWVDARLRQRGFDVGLKWVSSPDHRYEDRSLFSATSDVIWPTDLTTSAQKSDRFASVGHTLRRVQTTSDGNRSRVFPDPLQRRTLETALLDAGMEILSRMSKRWPPLGYAGERIQERPLGFGTLAVSFRNCPNNAPLALWWDAQDWVPLFPRRTYAEPVEIHPTVPTTPLSQRRQGDDVSF